jgi:phosphinothricin acetyltransferase
VIALRFARADDAAALCAILDPLVRGTAMNFAAAPPAVVDFGTRIEIGLATHPWIVAVDDTRVLGYTFARGWSATEGERWSVETGLALAAEARGKGLGTRLYSAVLDVLAAQGFHNAFAGITIPNPASERLHERLGFRRYGVIERSGWKLGRWYDTSWWQKRLVDGDPTPGELRSPHEFEARLR